MKNGYQSIQIEAHKLSDADEILKAAGVKRIHSGWYTVWFNGVVPDTTNVTRAVRNRKGEIKA